MPKNGLRIFIGPARIGNMGSVLASAFREKGFKVTHVIDQISKNRVGSGMEYDILLDFRNTNRMAAILKLMYYSSKFFTQHNVFIFLFGTSLLPYNLDLPLLKLFRKRTIMWFVGSDIRHYESLKAAAEKAGVKYYYSKDKGGGPEALRRKLRMIRMVEKYVDHIATGPSFAQLLTRKYVRLRLPLDICNIRHNVASNPRPQVVHAPSNDEVKGTAYVVEAIDRLKGEGFDFELHLFRNVNNNDVREALSRADIAIDQLFATGPGTFAVEAMAAGCAVLGGNIPEFAGLPKELPIIHTDPDSIYRNLKMVLENPELRRDLGEKGRRYVEKYHDHRKVADDVLRLVSQDERL